MWGLASSKLRMSFKDFLFCTPSEIFRSLYQWNKNNNEDRKLAYMLARLNAYSIVKTRPGVEYKFNTPKEFMPFEWEKNESNKKIKKLTPEEWEKKRLKR